MKRLIITVLLAMAALLSTANSVKTEIPEECFMMLVNNGNTLSSEITPLELVSRAYQGAYRTEGIPGFGTFIADSASGKITAKDLIQAAIDAKQLSPDVKTNRNYLNAVDLLLR
jgi:hypothetical protein